MAEYIGAIDQGTTSTRFIIFNRAGRIVASRQKEHRQIYPQPGWVEHDPIEIWQNTAELILAALRAAALQPQDLAGIGITNQRETTLLWDRETGKPLHNAVVWQDTRTDQLCRRLAEKGGQDRFRAKTGLPLATYFSGPKVRWLMENDIDAAAALREGRALFGTIDSWILWNLTGGIHATDISNASRTLLMNLESLAWDADILKEIGIPTEILPKICSSSEIFGLTRRDGFLKAEIPVAGILGDQQAALVGQSCFAVGEAKNTYGTGCFLLLNTGREIVRSQNGLLTTVAYRFGQEPASYALEGSIAITGALVQWVRDNLGLIEKSADIEALARSVEDNGGICFVPAFAGLFAPHWRSDARGVLVGLTGYINRGHIARAVLEATAFQTREIGEAMNKDSGIDLKSLKVDGGMVVNELLMQFQADMLNVPVIRPTVTETTALGAAYAAGLATGFWRNTEELRAHWQEDKRWLPQMKEELRQQQYRMWQKAVQRSLGWAE